jgi:hypothetical protein
MGFISNLKTGTKTGHSSPRFESGNSVEPYRNDQNTEGCWRKRVTRREREGFYEKQMGPYIIDINFSVYWLRNNESSWSGQSSSLADNEAIVFGKLLFIEHNQEMIPYGGWTRGKPRMSFFRVESEEYVEWGFDPIYGEDGNFSWIT